MMFREVESLADQYFEDESYYDSLIKYMELYLMGKKSLDQLHILFDAGKIELVHRDLMNAYVRLQRIISYGNEWDEDEWLLMLTIRVEIKLVLQFLSEPAELKGMNEIDDFFLRWRDDKDYIRAKNQILRNWKSIDKKWLNTFIP